MKRINSYISLLLIFQLVCVPNLLPLRSQESHTCLAAKSLMQSKEQTGTHQVKILPPSQIQKRFEQTKTFIFKLFRFTFRLFLFFLPYTPLAFLLTANSLINSSCSDSRSSSNSAVAPLRYQTIDEYNQHIHDGINVRNQPSTLLITDDLGALISQRKQLLDPLTRAEVVTKLGLTGMAETIFLNYGVVVEGASERNLFTLYSFLQSTPAAHRYNLHEYLLRSNGDGYAGLFYKYPNGSIIFFSRSTIEKANGALLSTVLAHETGHNDWSNSGSLPPNPNFPNAPTPTLPTSDLQRFQALHNQSDKTTDEDFVSSYAKTNDKEDYAETYALWRDQSDFFIETLRMSSSAILREKMLIVAKRFVFRNGSQPFIRIYRNGTYFNIFLTLLNNDPNNLTEAILLAITSQPPSTNLAPDKIVDYLLATLFPNGITDAALHLETELRTLASQGKTKEIIEVIYRLQGHYSVFAATLLQNLEGITRTSPILTFDPVAIQNLDQLNAYLFLDPQGVENWFLTDLQGSMQKLKDLSRSFDSNQPIHIFLTLSFLYDKYLNTSTQNISMRDVLLTVYKNHLNSLYTSYFLAAQTESRLLDKWLQKWDPNYSTITVTVPIKTQPSPSTQQPAYQEYKDYLKWLKNTFYSQDTHTSTSLKSLKTPLQIYQIFPNGKMLLWLPPRDPGFDISI